MLLLGVLACSGEPAQAPPPPLQAAKIAVSDALVAQTWQVRLAPDSARGSFEGKASWTAYFKGDRVAALQAIATENDPAGVARMHAEFAAMYEEAALMAANSVKQDYAVNGQPTDPVETAYLLGEAGVILDDAELMKNFGKCGASTVPGLAKRDADWKKWVQDGASANWPTEDIAAALPTVTPGQAPAIPSALGYKLPEQTPEHLPVAAADLMTLNALALWHFAAVSKGEPGGTGGESAIMGAHAPPGWFPKAPPQPPGPAGASPAAAPTVATSDSTLFLGAYTTGGDLALDAALRDPRTASGAVAAHVADSPYAAIIQSCTSSPTASTPASGTASASSPVTPSGIAVDCILDQSAALGTAIQDGMAKAAGGAQDFHRFFADDARAGVIRVAANAAFAAGDTDTGGRLRLNAIDKAVGKAYDPVFALQVAAWDAGNGNTVRATEMVHALVDQIPGLDVARIPLDALHVRLSRSAAPAVPMH